MPTSTATPTANRMPDSAQSLCHELSFSEIKDSLDNGIDILGERFMTHYSAKDRRPTGSTYTPEFIVKDMMDMVSDFKPDIVVDCGCGSGRFAIASARAFPKAQIIAIDNSDVACQMCTDNVRALDLQGRITILNCDFMDFSLSKNVGERGKVLWIGNPPYTRHHDIDNGTKLKFKKLSSKLGTSASGLSGMHTYFLTKIASLWASGDRGVLVTSAEWLDVNYGSSMRQLLTDQLRINEMHIYSKESRIFDGAETTAVAFSFGDNKRMVRITTPGECGEVNLDTLKGISKWSSVLSRTPSTQDSDLVPLGSIASVHRGVVTGDNRFWVRKPESLSGIPDTLTTPVVSHAKEIMGDCAAQENPSSLARLITLPSDLDTLTDEEACAAWKIIEDGLRQGVNTRYVASHRKPWWSIEPSKPPAIMMTYMARRSPVFVANRAQLSMLNVVHGIYPIVPLTTKALNRLVNYLNTSVREEYGRTYCGGLTKFEPKEAEAIPVPPLEVLER